MIMRSILVLAALLLLAACSGDPRSYGITGPGTQLPAQDTQASSADTAPTAGVPVTGTYYGPSQGSATGASGFWGYNQ